MKLLCDQMLGTLAKWLRILGFDTFYANNKVSDNELLYIAKNENRILISRDKELIIRGKKRKLVVIEIKTTDLDDQLKKILDHIDLNEKILLSRCTHCNSILGSIEKNEIMGKVPKKVFENNEKFWYCKKCGKYYWQGSHYENILQKIQKLKKNTNQQ